MIYLDNAATTKVSQQVLDEVLKCHNVNYGNSSGKHIFGRKVKNYVEQSRKKVANLINSDQSEIYFTSGSTEGINTALRGFVEANIDKGNHIITTKVEHKAVLETCNYLESIGIDITYLDVDKNGVIDLQDLENSIKPETILTSILWVNNETGIIQDLESISGIVKKYNSKLFIDATQAVGKIPVDVKSLKIDLLCLSAHKFYGPKGIGALYVAKDITIKPLHYGGSQESSLRAGTTNAPGVLGLGKACEIAILNDPHVKKTMEYLEKSLLKSFNCEIVGANSNRSPYITNILFYGIDADVVVGKLNKTIVSTGSACSSEINEPSHVLKNMGINDQKAFGAIRFSLSNETMIKDIDLAILELEKVIKQY